MLRRIKTTECALRMPSGETLAVECLLEDGEGGLGGLRVPRRRHMRGRGCIDDNRCGVGGRSVALRGLVVVWSSGHGQGREDRGGGECERESLSVKWGGGRVAERGHGRPRETHCSKNASDRFTPPDPNQATCPAALSHPLLTPVPRPFPRAVRVPACLPAGANAWSSSSPPRSSSKPRRTTPRRRSTT